MTEEKEENHITTKQAQVIREVKDTNAKKAGNIILINTAVLSLIPREEITPDTTDKILNNLEERTYQGYPIFGTEYGALDDQGEPSLYHIRLNDITADKLDINTTWGLYATKALYLTYDVLNLLDVDNSDCPTTIRVQYRTTPSVTKISNTKVDFNFTKIIKMPWETSDKLQKDGIKVFTGKGGMNGDPNTYVRLKVKYSKDLEGYDFRSDTNFILLVYIVICDLLRAGHTVITISEIYRQLRGGTGYAKPNPKIYKRIEDAIYFLTKTDIQLEYHEGQTKYQEEKELKRYQPFLSMLAREEATINGRITKDAYTFSNAVRPALYLFAESRNQLISTSPDLIRYLPLNLTNLNSGLILYILRIINANLSKKQFVFDLYKKAITDEIITNQAINSPTTRIIDRARDILDYLKQDLSDRKKLIKSYTEDKVKFTITCNQQQGVIATSSDHKT